MSDETTPKFIEAVDASQLVLLSSENGARSALAAAKALVATLEAVIADQDKFHADLAGFAKDYSVPVRATVVNDDGDTVPETESGGAK